MIKESPFEFIENSNVGIHAVSPEGIITYANQCELDTLGYSKNEYVGHHVSEFQMDKLCLDDMMTRLGSFETFTNYPAKVRGKEGIHYILYNSTVYQVEQEFIHTRCFGNEISSEIYAVFYQELFSSAP